MQLCGKCHKEAPGLREVLQLKCVIILAEVARQLWGSRGHKIARSVWKRMGQPVRGSNNQGLWATVVATELTMLEGGGQTETGACGAPQVRAHLRVAQASGTAELEPRAEASGTTSGPLRQRNGDPKRWPVRHRDGLEGGSERSRKRSRTVSVTGDRNAELCTGCGKGGHLYCCDGCPRVWHAGCLHGKGGVPPKSEGRWYGPCCSQGRAGGGCAPDQ